MRFPSNRGFTTLALAWAGLFGLVALVVRPHSPLTAAFLSILLMVAPIAYFAAEAIAKKLPEIDALGQRHEAIARAPRLAAVLIGLGLFVAAEAAFVGIAWYFS